MIEVDEHDTIVWSFDQGIGKGDPVADTADFPNKRRSLTSSFLGMAMPLPVLAHYRER